jgi:hypothetical protein
VKASTARAIDENTGKWCEDQRGNLPEESNDAEQKHGAGQPIHQPAGGDAGDPRADERDSLPAEEEAIVAVLKCPGEMQRFPRAFARWGRGVRHGWRERNIGAIYNPAPPNTTLTQRRKYRPTL